MPPTEIHHYAYAPYPARDTGSLSRRAARRRCAPPRADKGPVASPPSPGRGAGCDVRRRLFQRLWPPSVQFVLAVDAAQTSRSNNVDIMRGDIHFVRVRISPPLLFIATNDDNAAANSTYVACDIWATALPGSGVVCPRLQPPCPPCPTLPHPPFLTQLLPTTHTSSCGRALLNRMWIVCHLY